MRKLHPWMVAGMCAVASAAMAQSAERGKELYAAKCAGCHSVDSNQIGPMHQGLLGRKAGSVAGFDYSPALRRSNIVWTHANLLAWLQDPETLIPDQGMDVSLASAQDREDMVAYLATLSRPKR